MPAEFFREEILTARKEHRCIECRGGIYPGQQYERVVGKWEGYFSTVKTCMICAKIRDTYCDSFNYGTLQEALWECLGVDYLTGAIDVDEED